MKTITNEIVKRFELYLYEEEKSDNTIEKYMRDIRFFREWLGGKSVNKSVVLAYKKELCEKYLPASVNSILSSLNALFMYMNWYDLKVKTLKIQRRIFADKEKELTKSEYERLLTAAKNKKNERLYYLMQTIGSTGVRISELKYITCEAVYAGQATINCKGKIRQVFLPKQLCKMLKTYIKQQHIKSGSVFITKSGKPLDRSTVWKMLKGLCESANVARSTGGDDILGVTPIISAGDIITYKPNTGDDKISLLSVGTLSSGGSSAGGSPGGGGGSSIAPPVSLAPPTIEKGKYTGDETIVIPDENGYSYIVRMNVSGGNDKYYNKIYYNTLAKTSLAKRASRVTNETDIINIELVKQYYISGNINAVGFEDSHNRITVASQRSETIIEDIYDCDFSIYTEIYGVGNYGMYVPAEFEKYVLRLNSFATGRTIYYHPDECVDDLPESKVLTVKHDMADIDFDYSGYNPDTPLMIDLTRSMGEWRVRLSNIGDFDTDTIDLYISFYNKQGAMTNLIREYAGIIEGRSVNEIYVTVPDSYLTNVETIKVMAWNNLKPMANVLELSNTSINDKMIASAYMQVGETTVYHRGEEHVVDIAPIMVDGVLYAPVRAIAETLGWTVNRINDDAETIKITDQNGYVIILTENEIKAKIDGDTVSLLNPPIVVNGRMMIPFENIASYMGYECVQNNDFGTIAVYDSIDWKVKYIFENNMVPDVLKNSLVEERLTRKELAAIIVNTYETINCKTIDIERKPFYDCDDENVLKACSLGIIGGFEDSTFKPDSLLTRAEYSKAMYSLLNLVGLDVQFDKVNTTDYDDITDSHWASGYVYGLNEIGIFDGIFDGLFKPENAITIREALAILGNAYKELKQSEFTDIPNTHPYILAITNVSNKGIMVGYEDGTFMPELRMMRSEFTALITRMDGEEIRQSQTFSCLDVPQNHWASGCIEYCINKGVMKLENNVFRPDVEITIGETIDALMNYLGFAPTLDIQEKLIQAEKIGLLNGVVDEITIEEHCLRGMMAQLINNALNIDMENL